MPRYVLLFLGGLAGWCQAAAVHAASETVKVVAAPMSVFQRISLPLPSGELLQAHWWPAEPGTAAAAPAVVALHGCGGLYAKSGQLSLRYRETAQSLHDAGYAVLLPDSLGSRGVPEICTTRYSARQINVALRVQDARAALAWVAAQPGVDAQRIGVQGWSNGASTTLHLLEARQAHPQAGEPPLAGAALFYPGCAPLLRRHAVLENVPLLLQLGALDDWTPPQPCVDFAQTLQARAGSDVTVRVYADSYHGFDGTAPVRLRTEVPNGRSPQGVHQGGNPQARQQALAVLDTFWRRVLGNRPVPAHAP